MKKIIILLMIIGISNIIKPQDGADVGWVARFGIAGGFDFVMLFPKMDDINAKARAMELKELSTSSMITWGGGGYAYIMMVNNLRIGGIGFGGSMSTSGNNAFGLNRQLDYNFGLGGVTIEYTLPFIQHVAVSVGSIIGVGSQSIETFENWGEYTWANTTPPPIYSSIARAPGSYTKITNTFFTIVPTLNLDLPLNRFIALRAGTGYIFNFNNSWKVNNDRNISGVPGNLTKGNFFIQAGIYFGFFAF